MTEGRHNVHTCIQMFIYKHVGEALLGKQLTDSSELAKVSLISKVDVERSRAVRRLHALDLIPVSSPIAHLIILVAIRVAVSDRDCQHSTRTRE